MNSRLLLIVPIRLNKSSFFIRPNASIRCRASRFSPDIYSHPPSLYACLREKFKTLANETCWFQRSVQMSRWEENCFDNFVTRRSVATKTSRSRVSIEDTTLAGQQVERYSVELYLPPQEQEETSTRATSIQGQPYRVSRHCATGQSIHFGTEEM